MLRGIPLIRGMFPIINGTMDWDEYTEFLLLNLSTSGPEMNEVETEDEWNIIPKVSCSSSPKQKPRSKNCPNFLAH